MIVKYGNASNSTSTIQVSVTGTSSLGEVTAEVIEPTEETIIRLLERIHELEEENKKLKAFIGPIAGITDESEDVVL